MYQIDLPKEFAGRRFVDLFRALLSKSIFVLALYRRPDDDNYNEVMSTMLPFFYTSPANNVELRAKDRLFVFCNPAELNYALHGTFGFSLVQDSVSGTMHLCENTTPYTPPTGVVYKASDLDKVDYTKLKNSAASNPPIGAVNGVGRVDSERKQPTLIQKPTPVQSSVSESRSIRLANLNVPFTVVEVSRLG